MAEQAEIAKLFERYREGIREMSPRSLAIYERNRTVTPGGVGSRARLADPFPMIVREAKGARIWDADGNEYLDCMLAFGTQILGNSAPEVQAAIMEALPRGTSFALCHEREYELAKLFVEMVPSVEKVTFCNSGTEATMYATRVARAATGRPLIAKFEGGYHGTHDALAVSMRTARFDPEACGPDDDPRVVAEHPGLAEGAYRDTIVLPYNNPATFAKIRKYGSQLAGVIVEPAQGAAGAIPAKQEFLRGLREVTHEIGAYLIFDEVITGFRLAPGGAQEYFGISPDLTTFGKVPGGGLPIGALGGPRDKLAVAECDVNPNDAVFIGGTFNGNPITVAAGIATLTTLKNRPDIYSRLNAMGDRFRAEINKFATDNDFPAHATGLGSMIWMHTVRGQINCIRDLSREHSTATTGLKLLFRRKGLHISSNHGFLSAAHSDEDIARLIDIHKAAMMELRNHEIW